MIGRNLKVIGCVGDWKRSGDDWWRARDVSKIYGDNWWVI